VKILTIVFLIWLAPAILVLCAMVWSLWPWRASGEELAPDQAGPLDTVKISALGQNGDGLENRQPGPDDECEDDLESLAGR
jgi:hypothetical protein